MELIEHKNKSPLHMTWRTYFPPVNLLFNKPLYKNMLSLSLRHQYFITFELTLGNSCIIVSIAKFFVACILIGILEPTIKMRAWIYRKEWVIEWLSFSAISAIVLAISWREQVNVKWDYDEVRFALYQHVLVGFL